MKPLAMLLALLAAPAFAAELPLPAGTNEVVAGQGIAGVWRTMPSHIAWRHWTLEEAVAELPARGWIMLISADGRYWGAATGQIAPLTPELWDIAVNAEWVERPEQSLLPVPQIVAPEALCGDVVVAMWLGYRKQLAPGLFPGPVPDYDDIHGWLVTWDTPRVGPEFLMRGSARLLQVLSGGTLIARSYQVTIASHLEDDPDWDNVLRASLTNGEPVFVLVDSNGDDLSDHWLLAVGLDGDVMTCLDTERAEPRLLSLKHATTEGVERWSIRALVAFEVWQVDVARLEQRLTALEAWVAAQEGE